MEDLGFTSLNLSNSYVYTTTPGGTGKYRRFIYTPPSFVLTTDTITFTTSIAGSFHFTFINRTADSTVVNFAAAPKADFRYVAPAQTTVNFLTKMRGQVSESLYLTAPYGSNLIATFSLKKGF